MQAPRLRPLAALALTIAECAGATPDASTTAAPPSSGGSASEVAHAPAAPAGAKPVAVRPDAPAIFAQLKGAFDACYQAGKKSTPTMLDGKLTLNASFDGAGKATCAIPTEASGLTQQVEDCMSDRLAASTFGPGEPWTEVVPIALRAGVLGLGERDAKVTALESIETRRMPDAFDVLEALVPRLEACLHDLDRASGIHGIVVAANIGADGRARCVLASPSSGALAPKVSVCMHDAFAAAKFPPPTGGPGVILVPLNLVGR